MTATAPSSEKPTAPNTGRTLNATGTIPGLLLKSMEQPPDSEHTARLRGFYRRVEQTEQEDWPGGCPTEVGRFIEPTLRRLALVECVKPVVGEQLEVVERIEQREAAHPLRGDDEEFASRR